MTVQCPFQNNNETQSPSLILIDEIENGLDFKSLTNLIKYLFDYSDETQMLFTSHSPLVCELVHPKNWLIAKRNGFKVVFNSPTEIEADIKSRLDIFKQRHWDFYTNHISNSSEYQLNE